MRIFEYTIDFLGIGLEYNKVLLKALNRRWRRGHWTHTACHSMGKPRKEGGPGPTQLKEGDEGRIQQHIG